MHKIFKNTLFKVFTLNGISVIVKMLVSFFSVKIYALFIGPEGFALIGNFKNFSSVIKTFSTVGFDNGIVSLVSESKNKNSSLQKIYATSFYSRLLISLLVSLTLLVLPYHFEKLIINDIEIDYIIQLFAIVLPFYSINNLLISILNGLGNFNKLILINIISTVLGFLILGILTFYLNINGAFIYLAIGESLIIIVTLFFLKNQEIYFSIKKVDQKVIKQLLSFSIMTLASAIIVPSSNLFIRKMIINNLNITKAGYWESLNRISSYYMLIIISSITMYYLPKISRIKTISEFNQEFKNYLKIFGIGFLLFGLIMFISKSQVISFALSEKFLPIEDLLIYQLLADFFKLITLFFGYKMIADRDIKKYLFVEVLFYTLYVSLSFFVMKNFSNIKYVLISYLLSQIVIFIIVILLYRNHFFRKNNSYIGF